MSRLLFKFLSLFLVTSILILFNNCENLTSIQQDSNVDDSPDVDVILNPLPENPILNLLSSGHTFTEGPAYHKGLNKLYFTDHNHLSDPSQHKIYSTDLNTGVTSLLTAESGGINGMHFDQDFNLIGARAGENRGVFNLDPNNANIIKTYPSQMNELFFSGPNDLELGPKGELYFTDPTFGKFDDDSTPYLNQRGVYKINTETNAVVLLDEGYIQPNGVAASPDGTFLYVSDSQTNEIYQLSLNTSGEVIKKELFYFVEFTNSPYINGAADGMAIDVDGNLYVTGNRKVTVLNPEGEIWGALDFPEKTTNCSFGGPDNKTLFVTTESSVYAINLNVTGF